MNDQISTLFFVSIFHIIGGIAIGSTLRGLRNGFSCNRIFLLVWGMLFGCLPLSIGAQTFANTNTMYLFVVEVLVLASAILGSALIPDWMLDALHAPDASQIGVGSLFFLIGVFVGGTLLKTEPVLALVFGGIFAGAGAFVLFRGLRSLLQRPRL